MQPQWVCELEKSHNFSTDKNYSTSTHTKSCNLSTTTKNHATSPPKKNHATSPQKKNATTPQKKSCNLFNKKGMQPLRKKKYATSREINHVTWVSEWVIEWEKSRNLSTHKNQATSPHTKSPTLSTQKVYHATLAQNNPATSTPKKTRNHATCDKNSVVTVVTVCCFGQFLAIFGVQ